MNHYVLSCALFPELLAAGCDATTISRLGVARLDYDIAMLSRLVGALFAANPLRSGNTAAIRKLQRASVSEHLWRQSMIRPDQDREQ